MFRQSPEEARPAEHQPLLGSSPSSTQTHESVQTPKKRTFLEKALIFCSLAFLIYGIAFTVLYFQSRSSHFPPMPFPPPEPDHGLPPDHGHPHPPPPPPTDHANICTGKECVLFAANMIESMDESKNPCEDFYAFTCRGWQNKRDIPAHKVRIGVFDQLAEKNALALRRVLESDESVVSYASSPNTNDDESGPILQKLRDVYGSCMNVSHIDALSTDPLMPKIKAVNQTFQNYLGSAKGDDKNGVNRLYKALNYVLVDLHLIGVSPLMDIEVEADPKKPDVQTIYLSQPSLGLPSKEYYLEADFTKVYTEAISKMFAIFFGKETRISMENQNKPSSQPDWHSIAKDVTDFESKLANISWSNEQLSDPVAVYNPYNLNNLTSLVSYVDVKQILNNTLRYTGSKSLEELDNLFVVSTPSYFKDLEEIILNANPETVNAYFIWRLILKYYDTLGESVKDGMSEFKEKVLGVSPTSKPPRHETCLKYVDSIMGFAAGKFFVDVMFPGDSKKVAEDMTNSIIESFKRRIEALDWLDDKTRAGALEKMNALLKKIGYPEFIKSQKELWDYYADLLIIKGDFFGNYYRRVINAVRENWQKLLKPTDIEKWHMFPQTVNAYYNPLVNEIVFPAGILQRPFFDAKVPSYLNYGGIGLVQGHEVSHGVDNMGRHYDSKGRLEDWWTPETNANFEEKSKCFIDQYSSYYITDGSGRKIHVNGKLTLGENLADNGGLRQAWNAYKSNGSHVQQRMPGLEKYTPDQLFFINFAQVWCGQYRPEYSLQAIRTDPHSPPFVRVNAAVSNSIPFSEAFQCPAGSKMNPPKKCSIW